MENSDYSQLRDLIDERGAKDYSEVMKLAKECDHQFYDIAQSKTTTSPPPFQNLLWWAAREDTDDFLDFVKYCFDKYEGDKVDDQISGRIIIWGGASKGMWKRCEAVINQTEEGKKKYYRNLALRQLASYGHQSACQEAIESGADDLEGAVRLAAFGGHENMCQWLWSNGANGANGAKNAEEMLIWGALGDQKKICLLAKNLGATKFSNMLFTTLKQGISRLDLSTLAVSWLKESETDLGKEVLEGAIDAICESPRSQERDQAKKHFEELLEICPNESYFDQKWEEKIQKEEEMSKNMRKVKGKGKGMDSTEENMDSMEGWMDSIEIRETHNEEDFHSKTYQDQDEEEDEEDNEGEQ